LDVHTCRCYYFIESVYIVSRTRYLRRITCETTVSRPGGAPMVKDAIAIEKCNGVMLASDQLQYKYY
jgi:hypothetical protein